MFWTFIILLSGNSNLPQCICHFSHFLFSMRVIMATQVYQVHMVQKAKVSLALWFVSLVFAHIYILKLDPFQVSVVCTSLLGSTRFTRLTRWAWSRRNRNSRSQGLCTWMNILCVHADIHFIIPCLFRVTLALEDCQVRLDPLEKAYKDHP